MNEKLFDLGDIRTETKHVMGVPFDGGVGTGVQSVPI